MTARRPPASSDSSHTRRGVLATLGATLTGLTAGCAGLGGGNRNQPSGGDGGFADGEERVLQPTEIATDGRDGLMTERGIHLTNNHAETHAMSVQVTRDGSELFGAEYTLDEQDEVEIDDLFVTHGEYRVTVALDGETDRTLAVDIDPKHLGVHASVFQSGSFEVWQVLCDTNSCP